VLDDTFVGFFYYHLEKFTMARKATYEELEKEIKELHNEVNLVKEHKKEIQKKLRLSKIILSATPDLLVLKDRHLVYQAVNPAFCKFFDKTEESILGKTDFDLFPRFEAETYRRDDLKVIKTGKPQIKDEKVLGNAEKRWLRVAKTPVLNEKGTTIGVLCSVVDVTNRKQAEAVLRESKERYRSLAESSLVGIWQTTLDGYTLYINPAMCQMLEIENPEELNGKSYDSFCDDENLEIVKRQLAKREKGLSSTYEVELIGRKGTKRNVMISAAPIFLSEDNVHSTIGTFTDITDKKRAEDELVKAHNELEQRVKKRTRELEAKKNSLEEINTAMKVLLKKREEDKIDIEKNVMTNVKELIQPYFEKIKKTGLGDQQRALLSIMESNINEIVSPFTRTMSLKYFNLTPTEIRIANLIRHGSRTKEIAELMAISPKTVETHRRNIRRKIGLDHKRANLRSHLLSLH
jgi:PAS domain S-box-containing protein